MIPLRRQAKVEEYNGAFCQVKSADEENVACIGCLRNVRYAKYLTHYIHTFCKPERFGLAIFSSVRPNPLPTVMNTAMD
jgi:hypothetical protein